MIGRSNLQQAVPVTFGYKMAGLLETGAMETQAGLCAELGLAQPVIAWHTVRDTIAEVGTFLGLVGGTLGKLSMDVKPTRARMRRWRQAERVRLSSAVLSCRTNELSGLGGPRACEWSASSHRPWARRRVRRARCRRCIHVRALPADA